MYSRLVKNPLWCSIIVHGIYRMLHLTGAPLKVLSVSLVITGLNFQTGATPPPPPKKKKVLDNILSARIYLLTGT